MLESLILKISTLVTAFIDKYKSLIIQVTHCENLGKFIRPIVVV